MKTNDYIKFITEQLVKYLDEPKEARLKRQAEKRSMRPPKRESLFGLVPVAISHSYKKLKRTVKESKESSVPR